MKKPKPKTVTQYDYTACRDYICQKHKVDDGPLWSWLCDCGVMRGNDSVMHLPYPEDGYPEDKEAHKMLSLLWEEFGDKDSDLTFFVSW